VSSRWGTATNSYGNIWVAEISNIASTNALDQAIGSNGSSQTPTTGNTGSLSQAAEIGFAVVGTMASSVAGITNPPRGAAHGLADMLTARPQTVRCMSQARSPPPRRLCLRRRGPSPPAKSGPPSSSR